MRLLLVEDSSRLRELLTEAVHGAGWRVDAVATIGEATEAVADHVLEIPEVPELLSQAVAIVPLQALAYGVARERGNDVDRPRNLAKVVTVE